ncbi:MULTISPECIES: DNA polymerase III subunit gamma/tau [unclassified Pedobacter]|uniref:DNA polymerase III subunit gamma/tau n=1 Tax=unclassified Pedobacter TaxID=2628915 RepID=UPI0014245BFA|nr:MULTISPECIES: DNA polymerase III subunit gamma/tau [unclassified Pedobacter]NII81457.1 DNA polymerase-3 subunit gamma/tau [Pedobacter sp. SG908]NMN35461.1 DNA polymerase-3 subunit gamma/tau [Pedobacter sp. SG918]
MENFIVSARKYRPATFETVVGQQHITGTLKNAIKNNQLAQAFLFCGPRGVGKTTCARILAKTINCTNPTADMEACGQCDNCLSFQNGHSFNVHELDAASNNSVDDIRSLIEQVRIPPQAGKYKIYIIDEVHMLSQSAFNAFLKTLEEPPSYAIFILATTEKHKILPTILSRCQIFDFNRIQVEDIANHLSTIAQRENIAFESDGLHIIAQKADGGLRDALSMFDQIASYANKNITYKAVIDNLNILDYDYFFKLTSYLTAAEVSQTLLLFDEILNNGFDGNNFINGLATHFRNLLVGKDASTIKLLEVSENIKQKYLDQCRQTELSFLLTALNLANTCDLNYKNSKNQRLQVELALIKMCHIRSVVNLAQQPLNPNNTATDVDQDKKKTNVVAEQAESPKLKAESEKTISVPAPALSAPVLPNILPEEKPKDIPRVGPQPSTTSISINIPKANAISTLIPSLNDLERIAQGDDDEGPKKVTGDAREAFSYDRLLEVWNAFTQKMKAADKINLFTILNNFAPTLLNPELIEISVESKTQEHLVQQESVELLNFLRNELRNFGVEVTYKLVERKIENRLYGNREKYDYLVNKNPKLDELRRRFNLDINP